jgi:hypothetical protein
MRTVRPLQGPTFRITQPYGLRILYVGTTQGYWLAAITRSALSSTRTGSRTVSTMAWASAHASVASTNCFRKLLSSTRPLPRRLRSSEPSICPPAASAFPRLAQQLGRAGPALTRSNRGVRSEKASINADGSKVGLMPECGLYDIDQASRESTGAACRGSPQCGRCQSEAVEDRTCPARRKCRTARIETAGLAKSRTPLAFEFHRSSGQFYTDRASPFAPQ